MSNSQPTCHAHSPANTLRLNVALQSLRSIVLTSLIVIAITFINGCVRPPLAIDARSTAEMRKRLTEIKAVTLDQYKPESTDTEDAATPPAELPLTIDQCRAWVLANNLDLQVALLDPTIAEQRVTEEEARFESVLFGNVGYNNTRTPTASNLVGSETNSANTQLGVQIPTRAGGNVTVDLSGNRFETDNAFATLNPSFTSQLGVSVSQNLLRGAGFRVNAAPIEIARLSNQQSIARTRLEVIRAIAETDRLYWQLYAARQELEVRQDQHDLANAQLERARRQVEQGAAAEIEILRAESAVADGLEAIIIAANIVRERERRLKRLLNAPSLPMQGPTRLIPQTPANPIAYNLDAPQVIDDAMSGRMELLEIELALAQDALNIMVARNAKLPLAALSYRFSRNGLGADFGSAIEQDFQENFPTHNIDIRFEVPLGNQAARSALRSALLTRIQRIATQHQRERQIRQEVLDAIDNLDAAWQRVLASRQATILAARVLAAEQRQFDEGLNTTNEVEDAQIRLTDARSNEVRALTDYQVAQIDIAFATGTVLGAAQIRWAPRNPDIQE